MQRITTVLIRLCFLFLILVRPVHQCQIGAGNCLDAANPFCIKREGAQNDLFSPRATMPTPTNNQPTHPFDEQKCPHHESVKNIIMCSLSYY